MDPSAALPGGTAAPGPSRSLLADPRRAFVLTVWAGALVMGLAYAWLFSSNVPVWDDDWIVPALCGDEPVLGEWLFAQDAAHRSPLPRLLSLGIVWAAGDFRAGAWANFLLVGIGSLLCILAAWRIRGSASFGDAVIPLALQAWGPAVVLARPCMMLGALYLVLGAWTIRALPALRGPNPDRAWTAIGVASLLLVLTNSDGLLLALPLAAWILLRTPRPPRAALAAAGAALAVGILFIALYRRPESIPPAPSAGAVASTAFEVLGRAFGHAGAMGWKEIAGGSSVPPLFSFLALGLAGAAAVRLPGVIRAGGPDRPVAEGLLALLAGILLQAAAIGWGRSGIKDIVVMQPHYALFMAPLLAVVHLAMECGRRGGASRTVQAVLLLAAASTFLVQADRGYRQGREVRQAVAEFEADALAGMEVEDLARRHAPLISPTPETLETKLRRMRRAGLHPFGR